MGYLVVHQSKRNSVQKGVPQQAAIFVGVLFGSYRSAGKFWFSTHAYQ